MHSQVNHQTREDGIHVISFEPDVASRGNHAVSSFFVDDFLRCTADGHRVIVDLTYVDTIDSASLGPLVQRLRELQDRQGRLILCGLQAPALREIFSLTRFDQIFEITDNLEDALAKLQADHSTEDFDDWPT